MGVASQGFDQVRFSRRSRRRPSTSRTRRGAADGPLRFPDRHERAARSRGAGRSSRRDGRRMGGRRPRHRRRRSLHASPGVSAVASADTVAAAANLLKKAKRPVIVAGGGVHASRATDQLRRWRRVSTPWSSPASRERVQCRDGARTPPACSTRWARRTRSSSSRRADVVFWCGCKVGQNTSHNWTLPLAEQATIHLDVDAVRAWPHVPPHSGAERRRPRHARSSAGDSRRRGPPGLASGGGHGEGAGGEQRPQMESSDAVPDSSAARDARAGIAPWAGGRGHQRRELLRGVDRLAHTGAAVRPRFPVRKGTGRARVFGPGCDRRRRGSSRRPRCHCQRRRRVQLRDRRARDARPAGHRAP